jgi:hypothetical protein
MDHGVREFAFVVIWHDEFSAAWLRWGVFLLVDKINGCPDDGDDDARLRQQGGDEVRNSGGPGLLTIAD